MILIIIISKPLLLLLLLPGQFDPLDAVLDHPAEVGVGEAAPHKLSLLQCPVTVLVKRREYPEAKRGL